MKDLIISKWFEENSKFESSENVKFGDIRPMIESIAEYYSAHSLFVNKDFVIEFFDNMSLLDICDILKEYIDNRSESSKVIISDTIYKVTRRKKQFTCKGFTKDTSVLGEADIIEGSEEIPVNANEYIVVHASGRNDVKPLWFLDNMEHNDSNYRKLRFSFIKHYEKTQSHTIISATELSICNGKLFSKKYCKSL